MSAWLMWGWPLTFPVHDETYTGVWFCGACPYTNVGALCTKCGAPIGQATQV